MMVDNMITSLSLENWKSHSHTEFSFGKGTNVLVGRMGSGKSSVLDALCFALYGTFPKMQRRDQVVEDLVNSASGASAAVVKLEFEKGGKKYSVMRKVGKKASEAEVHENGKLVQKGQKAVTDYVEGILGVDYELFTRAIYSEQNRIDYLLQLNPKQRKGEIDWLLGLGQFDEAREAAQMAHGKLSESAKAYSQEAEPAKIAELKGKAGEQQGAVAQRKERYAALKQQLERLSSKVTHSSQEMLVLEKLRQAYEKKKSECERLEGTLSRLKKEAEGKEKPDGNMLEALAATYMERQKEQLESRQRLLSLQSEISGLKSEIAILENGKKLAEERAKKADGLEARIKALLAGKTIAELDAEAQGLKEEMEKLASLHATLHAEIAELTAAVHSLASAGAKCPVCDSELSGAKAGKISGEKEALLGGKKDELASSGALLKEKKAALGLLEKRAYDMTLCNAELARLKSEGIDAAVFAEEMGKKGEMRKGKESAFAKAGGDAAKAESELEQSRSSLESAQRAAKLFSDMGAAEETLTLAKDNLAKTDFSSQQYEEKRAAYGELRLSAAKLEAECAGEQGRIGLMEELLLSLEKELAQMGEKARLASEYAGASEGMALYKNSLTAAQSELRANLIEEINEALCEVWPAVYPYSDYTGVKIDADEKDYRLLMEKGGAWREVDSIASGGERACLCLALRIAFAGVLTPDIGVLILDEPTHNLDSDAVLLLSEAINTKIPSIVEQTFVITHDIALGETSEGTVFRLERDKGKNESTKVEMVD